MSVIPKVRASILGGTSLGGFGDPRASTTDAGFAYESVDIICGSVHAFDELLSGFTAILKLHKQDDMMLPSQSLQGNSTAPASPQRQSMARVDSLKRLQLQTATSSKVHKPLSPAGQAAGHLQQIYKPELAANHQTGHRIVSGVEVEILYSSRYKMMYKKSAREPARPVKLPNKSFYKVRPSCLAPLLI